MKHIDLTFSVLIGLLIARVETLGSETIIVPPTLGGYTAVSLYPFALRNAGLESMRYQQVFANTRFAGVSPQGVTITEIGFRVDPMTGVFSSQQPNFQVSLSTTTRHPDELSPIFSENIEMNETVVFGPGAIFWPDETPNRLAFGFVLETPFFYDPSQGNLLLDIRNFEAEHPIQPLEGFLMEELLGQDIFGDDVSRVYATSVDAVSGITDSVGLTTIFRVVPVPEPSTWALIGFMSAGLVFTLRKQQRSQS